MIDVRPAKTDDAAAWLRMCETLSPDSAGDHAGGLPCRWRGWWRSTKRDLAILGLALIAGGCAAQPAPREQGTAGATMTTLAFLTRSGCANTAVLRANLDEALRTLGPDARYDVIDLDTLPETDPRRGYPTPTVLRDGRDLFGLPEPRPPFPDPS